MLIVCYQVSVKFTAFKLFTTLAVFNSSFYPFNFIGRIKKSPIAYNQAGRCDFFLPLLLLLEKGFACVASTVVAGMVTSTVGALDARFGLLCVVPKSTLIGLSFSHSCESLFKF